LKSNHKIFSLIKKF